MATINAKSEGGAMIKKEPNIKSEGGDGKAWLKLPTFQPTSKPDPFSKPEKFDKASVKHMPNVPTTKPVVTPVSKARVMGNWVPRKRYGGYRHHPYSNATFRGTCYDCGQTGHRRGSCDFNIVYFEVNKKYKITDPGVVGSLNRIKPDLLLHYVQGGDVHYVWNNVELKIDNDAIVEVVEALHGCSRIAVPGTDINFLLKPPQ